MLRKERRQHEKSPRNHIRNVQTGSVVSSSLETVRRTSSIEEMSSSSTAEMASTLYSISKDDVIEIEGRKIQGFFLGLLG